MKKKSYGTVLVSILLVWAVIGWTIFDSTPDPQPAVEYRAVCRGLPTNAHWTDGSTRKEIPQTETSPNVREPSPVGTYGTSTSATECHFVCDGGYERKNEECKVPLIVYNSGAGTITITNGTTTYVLADRNVWATEVYNGSGTNCTFTSCPQSVAGYVFQRGNNYGFPAAGNWNSPDQAGITIDSSQIAWTDSHSTWITINPRYSDGNTGSLRGNSNNFQWPCSSGRHVPTTTERQNIFSALGTSQSAFSITKTLKLPPAGLRHPSTASANNVGVIGYYRSSSPASSVDNAYFVNFSSSGVLPQYSTNRSYGFSVRCLQDS